MKRMSPLKRVAVYGAAGAGLGLGGAALDQGVEQAPGALVKAMEVSGVTLACLGAAKAINDYNAQQTLKDEQNEAAERERMQAYLPKLRQPLSLPDLVNKLRNLEANPEAMPGVEAWVANANLGGSLYSIEHAAPESTHFAAFYEDIVGIIDDTATARLSDGHVLSARIYSPGFVAAATAEEQVDQLSQFLDVAVPLDYDQATASEPGNYHSWRDFIEHEVQTMTARTLVDPAPIDLPV